MGERVTAAFAAILRRLADRDLAEAIAGDLEEQRRLRARDSRWRAAMWFAGAAAEVVIPMLWQRLRSGVGSASASLPWSTMVTEVRQAARALARTPGTATVVVATLALGLGLNIAIFSVVHGVLFDPLPFDRADRLVFVEGTRRGEAPSVFGTSYPDYLDIAREARSFEVMATGAYWTFTVTDAGAPLRLVGQRVTGSFFPLLGMRPLHGRWIDPSDDRVGGPEVAVISHALWQRVLGADPGAIGRTLTLNGRSAEVIGVMPPSFAFPFEDVELWTPMLDEMTTVPRTSRFFSTIGRLRDGVTQDAAQEEVARIAAALERAHPATNRDWRPVLAAALPALTTGARPRLLLIFAAVLLVLVVAGINVAAIVAMRTVSRRRELGVRVALGAGRWQLGRIILFESACLGGVGLIGGLLMAAPAVAGLKALAPEGLPRVANVSISWAVMAWAAAAMAILVAGAALASLASLRVSHLTGVTSATVVGTPAGWGRRALIAGQVAGAFALLAGAGLLVRSFTRVLDVHPGFTPDQIVTLRVFLTPPTYRTLDQQTEFVARGLEVLRQAPGVRAADAVSQPPFDNEGGGTTLAAAVEGRTYAPGSHPVVAYRLVSPGYFHTMELPIVDGRALNDEDRGGTPLVGVINRAMADRLWPGERPIGRRFEFADGRNAGWITVVGIAGDVATSGLEQREPPAVYAPYVQRSLPFLRWMTFVVRTAGEPSAAIPGVRARLQEIDPRQPLYAVSTMAASIARSTAERRFSLVLMVSFAGLALGLAALGVYGMLAQRVALRSREIGVRLALGAVPADIVGLVLREGAQLVAVGIALGAGLATFGAPLIRDSLFGVSPFDGVTYGGIIGVLAFATLLASAVPALTASRTDPVSTLKGG